MGLRLCTAEAHDVVCSCSHYNKGRQGQAAIAICLTFHGPGGCSGSAGRCCGPEGQPMGVQSTISPHATILAHTQMLTASVIAAAVAFALGGFWGSSYHCTVAFCVRIVKSHVFLSVRTCDLTNRKQIADKSHLRFEAFGGLFCDSGLRF